MQFKLSQRVLWLAVFLLCAMPFAALADGTTPQTSGEHFAEGNKFYRLNDKDKAIADFTQAITLDSKLALAYKNRAIAYRQQNKIAEAEADEKKVKELSP